MRWPSADPAGNIVYELDGTLHVFDTRTKAERSVEIFVPDDGTARRPERVAAGKNIEGFDLSPKGARVLFAARGDIFSAPVEHGLVHNLTHSSNAHDREPAWSATDYAWSPDGQYLATPRHASCGNGFATSCWLNFARSTGRPCGPNTSP